MTTTYNKREMPHPILRPGGNDHRKDSDFSARFEIRRMPQARKIVVGVQYELKSDGLWDLIKREEVEFHTLVQCNNTRTRHTHRSREQLHRFDLDIQEHHGTVDLLPMVIAARDTSINVQDWSPMIRAMLPEGATVPAGAILAVAQPQAFDLDSEPEYASFIDLVPSPKVPPSQFNISLDGERIAIQVNPESKPDIDRLRQDEEQIQKLFPSIYLSAIERAIRTHRQEEHHGKGWARRIRTKLEEHGISPDTQDLGEKSLEYAQAIMDSPLGRITQENEQTEED